MTLHLYKHTTKLIFRISSKSNNKNASLQCMASAAGGVSDLRRARLLRPPHRRRQLLLPLRRSRFRLLYSQIHLRPRPVSFTTPQFPNLRLLLFPNSFFNFILLFAFVVFLSRTAQFGRFSNIVSIDFPLFFLASAVVRGFGK